jgi:ketosteroid isomerase-like protein
MEDQKRTLEAETEALRKAYAALNRNDVEGFIRDFHPQIVRIEFEGSPAGGTYHGLEAVREHVSKGRSTWAEGTCEPERFIVAGDKIIVLAHVRVRLKDHPDWLEGHTADVYVFRSGKVTQFRTFADGKEAFEWAGVDKT